MHVVGVFVGVFVSDVVVVPTSTAYTVNKFILKK